MSHSFHFCRLENFLWIRSSSFEDCCSEAKKCKKLNLGHRNYINDYLKTIQTSFIYLTYCMNGVTSMLYILKLLLLNTYQREFPKFPVIQSD